MVPLLVWTKSICVSEFQITMMSIISCLETFTTHQFHPFTHTKFTFFLSFFFFHDCLIINFWLATLIERILQKHKIADFGRELWSPSRKGCPEPCPDGFWTSPRKRLHTLSVQPMPVLHHHSEKNYFLMFKKTLCSSLCSLPPVLAPLKRA